MEKIIKLNTVKDYNDFLGIDTPHPLVGVIDALSSTYKCNFLGADNKQ